MQASAKANVASVQSLTKKLEAWKQIAAVQQSREQEALEEAARKKAEEEVNAENPLSQENEQQGRKLTKEEAETIVSQMEAKAEVAPKIKLTIENWDATFGENGRITTPIGEVKMGENQFIKLFRKKREEEFGMIAPTLSNPDVIVEKNLLQIMLRETRNTYLSKLSSKQTEAGCCTLSP